MAARNSRRSVPGATENAPRWGRRVPPPSQRWWPRLHPGPDRLRLGLHRRAAVLRSDVTDRHLLDLGVDRLGRNLLPGRDRGWRLGVGKLVTERGEQLVIGQSRVLPRGLDRWE